MAGTGCDCTPGEQGEHFSSGLGISVLLGASHAFFLEKTWSFVHLPCDSVSHWQSFHYIHLPVYWLPSLGVGRRAQ